MITSIKASNFKSWKTLDLPVSRITGLFGTNSSGKSSILQLLLMLKQTKDATDRGLTIDFGSPNSYVNLGSFSEVTHGHDAKQISWELCWDLPKKLRASDPLKSRKELIFEANAIRHGATVESDGIKLETNRIYYEAKGNSGNPRFALERGEKGFTLQDETTDYKFIRNSGRRWEIPSPIKSYIFPDQVQTYYKNTAFLSDLVHEYEQLIDRIFYLGPLREFPSRDYVWSGSRPMDVGKRGERAIDAILAARAQGETRNLGFRHHHKRFDEFIAFWLKELGLIHEFKVEEIKDGTGLYRVWVQKNPNSAHALITDVGFGVSQVLPIL
ncbi:MAG: AAA family ATPase, partial [Desulfovibrionaceae bacterium]